jgi:hypothetical protein
VEGESYQKMKRRQRARLASMEGSMIRCGGMTTPIGAEVAPRRGNGGDNISWVDANLTTQKILENLRGQFSWYKWMLKI